MSFGYVDIVLLSCYVLIVLFLSYLYGRRSKLSEGKSEKKGLKWFAVGASLFASAIGTEHILALSGAGAQGNFVFAQFEILAAFILLILGWVFAPFYFKTSVFSMPEFLEKRYSSSSRNFLTLVSILTYIITKISVIIFAGAKVIEIFLGLDFWSSTLFIIGLSGIFSIFVRFQSLVLVNYVQIIMMLLGSISVIYFGLDHLGGYSAFKEVIAAEAIKQPEYYLSFWRSASESEFPWPAIILGAPILGVWFWCTDQYIVRRVLGSDNLSEARKGTIFAGFLKIISATIFILPGVVIFAVSASGSGVLGFEFDGVHNADASFPAAVNSILPIGLKGLICGALVVGLVNSLSSVFESCSSLYVHDYYLKRYPKASSEQISSANQIVTVIMVVLGIAWLPVLKMLVDSDGLFYYLQLVQAYISPPIAVAFLFGLFYRKLNAKGASWSLWLGFAIGMLRLIADILTHGYKTGDALWNINPDGMIAAFVQINFLYFALIMFITCAIVLFAVSSRGDRPSDEKLEQVIFKRYSEKVPLWSNPDFKWSLLLVLAVILVWIIFSPLGIA